MVRSTAFTFLALAALACEAEPASIGEAPSESAGAPGSGGATLSGGDGGEPAPGGDAGASGRARPTGGVTAGGAAPRAGAGGEGLGGAPADGGGGGTGPRGGAAGSGGAPIDVCELPIDLVGCGPDIEIFGYAFDASAGTCVHTSRGGDCGGPQNWFSTLEDCEATCVGPVAQGGAPGTGGAGGAGSSVCELPFEAGDCEAAIPVFTFDGDEGRCVSATYGGCGGNGNRFATVADCAAACEPEACTPAGPPSEPGPYPVRFDVGSMTDLSYFVRSYCDEVEYDVYTCADGFEQPLWRDAFCTQECGTETSCYTCGACADPVAVTPTQVLDWSGVMLASDEGLCGTCYRPLTAPAGRYRVQVPFFVTEQAVIDDLPSVVCSVDFDLPDPDGVVQVWLGSPEADCVVVDPG